MPEYLVPGVSIEEIERGPKPVEGVSTSTVAVIGETARGPTAPRLVTSYADYQSLYGDVFEPGRYVPHSVKAFFDNGGWRCYVARIVGKGAATATASIGGVHVRSVGPGKAGNRTYVRLMSSTTTDREGKPMGFRLRIFHWDR